MRILDLNNNEVLNPDYSLGYVVEENVFVAHHNAVEAVKEVGHYETVAEYPNGGKDVKWVVDVVGVQAKDAWDEYEDILRYKEYTAEELAKKEEELNQPTLEDRIEARFAYIEMMTGLLEV